jgi:hypothetical protein
MFSCTVNSVGLDQHDPEVFGLSRSGIRATSAVNVFERHVARTLTGQGPRELLSAGPGESGDPHYLSHLHLEVHAVQPLSNQTVDAEGHLLPGVGAATRRLVGLTRDQFGFADDELHQGRVVDVFHSKGSLSLAVTQHSGLVCELEDFVQSV